MSVFIGWSGERSHHVALALAELVECVNSRWDPWVSDRIPVGNNWWNAIQGAIGSTHAGIACITPNALMSQWLTFEMGAVSAATQGRVIPYDIDNSAKPNRSTPLSGYQSCPSSKSGTLDLLKALNHDCGATEIEPEELILAFEKHWPEFEERKLKAPAEETIPDRNNLSKFGLENLLNNHFQASSYRIMQAVGEVMDNADAIKDEDSSTIPVTIRLNLESAIKKGRILLEPFYSDATGYLPEFLSSVLPKDQLEQRLAEFLKVINELDNKPEMRSVLSKLIEEEQSELLDLVRKEIRNRSK